MRLSKALSFMSLTFFLDNKYAPGITQMVECSAVFELS